MTMTRLIIVGGFLGAGKTTLLLQAAQCLTRANYRVGLITNDQGEGLVDTALAKHHDVAVTEVAGGCFCCRFPDLLKAMQELQTIVSPDIILAEPVGSCTDLVATVLRPLERFHRDVQLAPLTILQDAARGPSSFSPHVDYLFQQQLAEAQIIVLNKADLLSSEELEYSLHAIRTRQPRAKVFPLSARIGEGVEAWLNYILGNVSEEADVLELDYQRYAEAEAALAWLNAKGIVANDISFSPKSWLEKFLDVLSKSLEQAQAPIAHIKVQLAANHTIYKASLTQLNSTPTWDIVSQDNPTERLEFVLNARVNTSPQVLEQNVLYALESAKPSPGARFYFTDFECFQPSAPKPTYRFNNKTILESSKNTNDEQTTLLTTKF